MIGMSCTGFSSTEPVAWLDRIVGVFDLWEIFSEADHSISAHLDTFSDLLPSYDLSYSVHSPISDINIASLSDRVREASLAEIVSTADAANRLDMVTVTVHPGLAPMAMTHLASRAVERARESMRAIDRASEEYGVVMAIENMPDMPFFLGRTAKDLMGIIDGTDLAVCFDIGHANTTDQIGEMVSTFGDRIANIHIHDNDGTGDQHRTIGEGCIDFDGVLESLGWYGGNYVIEARSFESAVDSQSSLESLLS